MDPRQGRIPGQRWVSASPSGLPGGAMAVPRTPVTASLASDVPPAARPDGTLTPPAFPGENTTSGAAADAAAPVRAAPARSSSATAPAGAGPGLAPPVRADRTSWPPPDSGASCRGAPVAGCCGSALPIVPGSPVTSWAGWKPSVFGWLLPGGGAPGAARSATEGASPSSAVGVFSEPGVPGLGSVRQGLYPYAQVGKPRVAIQVRDTPGLSRLLPPRLCGWRGCCRAG